MSNSVDTEQPKTYLPTYGGCYVCGQAHERGLQARFYTGEDGKVHTRFTPEASQTSYMNICHGGLLSTLLDEIMGWPVALEAKRFAFTGEITVRFKKPVMVGQTYIATAYRATTNGKYWEGSGDIRDDAGNVYVESKGKYFLFTPEQSKAFAAALTYLPDDLPVFRE